MPNGNVPDGKDCNNLMSPSPSQGLAISGSAACRPQSAHPNIASGGSGNRLGQGSASPQVRSSGMPGQGSARDTLGYTARSAAASPRPGSSLSSNRFNPGSSTPKDSSGRPVRSATTSGGAEGFNNTLFTKTTPAAVLRGGLPLSGRNSASESPHYQSTPGNQEADFGSSSSRRQASTNRHERSNCSSSPALLGLEGQQAMTPRQGFPDGFGSSRKPGAPDSCPRIERVDSARAASGSRSSRSEAALFGPASSSRQSASPGRQAVPAPGEAPELFVTKWVDYASKYGVGYILSDGCIGVYFNDSTKIILVPDGSQFDYVTRRTQEKPEVRTTYTWDDYPEDLKKKVTLLRHFKNYMLTDVLEKKDGATAGESSLQPTATSKKVAYEPGQAPFVKKWTRNKHAIMFQLSNKIVQVVFFDKTEAVLSSKSHTVTYVDKRGQVQSYPLSNVLDVPSAELAKRLRYTKDILVNLLGTRAPAEIPGVGGD